MISTQIIFFPHVKKKQSRKTFESLCLHNVSLEHLFVLNQMTAAFFGLNILATLSDNQMPYALFAKI